MQPTPPTYPARPVNGGHLAHAERKHGDWIYEPKYNGWRALIHVRTGTMFNRQGKPLSIEAEFTLALCELQKSPFEWLDCECLERRHNIGRGTLIVLDTPQAGSFKERRGWLEQFFKPELGPELMQCQNQKVYLPPQIEEADAPAAWQILQKRNEQMGCTKTANHFYEGLVAKRADSHYPIQLRSPDTEFPFWMKHRWDY